MITLSMTKWCKIFFIFILLGRCSCTLYGKIYCESDIKLLAQELDKRSNGAYTCYGDGRYIVFEFIIFDNSQIPNFTVNNIVDHVEDKLASLCATNFIGAKYIYHYIDNAGNLRSRTITVSPLDFLNMTGNTREIISLKEHPKAAGINIEFTKPKGWEEHEGNGPHIVKKFEVGTNTFLIQISELPTFVSKKEADDLFHNKGDIPLSDFLAELFSNDKYTILSYNPDIINRYPALHVCTEYRTYRMGLNLFVYTNSWIVLYEDKMIIISGSSTSEDREEQKLFERMYSFLASNIRFPDQFNY